MMDWFRSWHGAPTDPKWLLIARNVVKRNETQCNACNAGTVSAVVWALFDHASQSEPRGNVEGFDVETYAVFSGFDEAIIAAIIEELKDKNLIVSGVLSSWQKRQPKREDSSTKRVREHRNAMKRNETHGNAREDKIREDKIDKKEQIAASPPRAVDKKSRKGNATALPDGYSLPDKIAAYGAEQGLSGSEIAREHQRFCNHAKQNDRRCVDWIAAERNWMLGSAEKLGKTPVSSEPVQRIGFYAHFGSVELDEWDRYGKEHRGKPFPRDKAGGWNFPSQWPPGYSPKAATALRDQPLAPLLRSM